MELSARRFGYAIGALMFVLVGGTIGFHELVNESWISSFYRAVITISLTGLDSRPPSHEAEIFTVIVLVAGVAIFTYVAGAIVEMIARGVVTGAWAEKRKRRMIDSMREHFIVCGYGRVGRRVCEEFRRQGQDYVVVDFNAEPVEAARERNELVVEGSGTEDENLEAAGLARAKGLVVASDDDADNLYIALSARNARPDLLIVARASDEEAAKKLRLAGADRIVEPYLAAGRVMANLVLKPQVTAFLDVMTGATGDDFRFEEIEILESSGQSGRTIGDLRVHSVTGAYIVALRKGDGSFDTTPGPLAMLERGDVVVAVGTAEELRAVEQIFAPREAVAR
jgi:voltage-gated potassium channel